MATAMVVTLMFRKRTQMIGVDCVLLCACSGSSYGHGLHLAVRLRELLGVDFAVGFAEMFAFATAYATDHWQTAAWPRKPTA